MVDENCELFCDGTEPGDDKRVDAASTTSTSYLTDPFSSAL